MVLPLYAVAAVAFGTVDPVLRTPVAARNPLQRDFTVFGSVLIGLAGGPLVSRFNERRHPLTIHPELT